MGINFTKLRENIQIVLLHLDVSRYGWQSLAEEGRAPYEACLDEMSRDDKIADKVARKTLESAVWNLLRGIKLDGDVSDATVISKAKALVEGLRNKVKWLHVYVPIENLVLDGVMVLRVGNVEFRPGPATLRRLKKMLFKSVDNHTQRSMEEPDSQAGEDNKRAYEHVEQHLMKLFGSCTSIAVVKVEAEPEAAQCLAYAEVEAAINLMRCFTRRTQYPGNNPGIGAVGSLASGINHSVVIHDDGSNASIRSELTGGMGSYEIDATKAKLLRSDAAFGSLSKVLSIPARDQTGIEKTITTAIRWIGNGVAAQEEPDKILCFCIALEVMMTGGQHGEISERLATRLAILLGTDSWRREAIYDLAKKLYGLRSSIVHVGGAKISRQNLVDYEAMAVRALIALGRDLHRWKSHDDFIKWIRQKQFA